jgi:esterase/lipase
MRHSHRRIELIIPLTLIAIVLLWTGVPSASAAPGSRLKARWAALKTLGSKVGQRARALWSGRRGPLPKVIMKHPDGAWLKSRAAKPSGVALMLHGMNINPTKMNTIAGVLNDRGVDCYRVTMTGHDGNLKAAQNVTRACFLRDASFGYEQAAARAKKLGVPLILVGYSIGAAVANDLMNQRERVKFDKMVLFAPGFTPNRAGGIFQLLRPFRSLLIPSRFPEAYQANRGTPVAVYTAGADIVKALKKKRFARSNVPAIIFADPKDMLVSTKRLKKMIQRYDLSKWQVKEVHGHGDTYKRGLGHLIIDQNALGSQQWKKVEAEIGAFLGN